MPTRAANQAGPSRADAELHQRICNQPTGGLSWSDRCTCGHLRGRHDAARHAPITTGNAVCTGRNLAGACLWPDCTCRTFIDTTKGARS
ncbi:hypothetical protein Val02_14000 [Virgisporangium aliadipatigenens]|uniref:Uncharacterized protein n=1 Tax=Virgisporangium aliadipatigenens TaxID=741659 RepID=A0A8J4DNK4_9ACTN|nr:hypothetical protein [Virgisporangium aliadipatigenens]GIJ44514.1 hypothetical protein Val02_14000 [Virgisporangium aliadipatigenens]